MMKSIKWLFVAFMAIGVSTAFAQSAQTATFKVYGNCGSCKKHIEKAVAVNGVEKADWNKDSKMMQVVFDPAKISLDAIQKKIAAVGYDTEKFRAEDKAYKALDECCQYDRKKG